MVVDDHRARLEQLRDQLTDAILSSSENMLPQLAGQLRATLADLAALPAQVEKVSMTDELKQRRGARRGPTAAVVTPPTGTGV